jgi:hypothetical protein
MIIDCHTHVWTHPAQLGADVEEYLRRETGGENIQGGPAEHERASRCTDKTLVLGCCRAETDTVEPNEVVAEYVAAHPDRMIGVAAIDPTDPDAARLGEQLLERPVFRGLTISPAGQDFHPADSRAMAVYELANERGVPVFLQQGTHFHPRSRMEYARPLLLDEIAREYPDLTLVIASMGHPWIEEGIALIGKHPRVFADIAGLLRRSWQAYNAMVLAHQFNVTDKILFGSDFPFYNAADAIKSVYRMHEMTQGTNLPIVPREKLRSIVERDAIAALGIARPGDRIAEPAASEADGEEDEEDLAQRG